MSGWRTTLWALPTKSSNSSPDTRANTSLPERITPLASVVEKNSSSIANGRARSTGTVETGGITLDIDRPRTDIERPECQLPAATPPPAPSRAGVSSSAVAKNSPTRSSSSSIDAAA